jgi:hypothetical protein
VSIAVEVHSGRLMETGLIAGDVARLIVTYMKKQQATHFIPLGLIPPM